MKYLDYPELEGLSRALTFESAECKVFTRIEAYSCKAVKRERQLFKTLESHYLHSASLSPPKHMDEALASPFGRLDQSHARKTLFLLIATLNGAFPDHDFSGVDPSDFRREPSSDSVLNSLGTTLLSLRSNSNAPRSFSSFPSSYDDEERHGRGAEAAASAAAALSSGGTINHPQLASILDDIMCIAECDVYTFHPDADSDPHASAEPDEEDFALDDDRYADDESGSGDDDDVDGGDDDGQDTHMATPRRQSLSFADGSTDDRGGNDDDTPMFDEDLLGFGFTPVHSRVSSTVTTPRTPSSARTRAEDYLTLKKAGVEAASRLTSFSAASRAPTGGFSAPTHMSYAAREQQHDAYADVDDAQDDMDDSNGLHGLLWATYAFFYNRKLKRILFVSVWSRRNNSGPVSYSFSPPSYPSLGRVPDAIVPSLSIDQAITSRQQQASPAKRAIAKSTGAATATSVRVAPVAAPATAAAVAATGRTAKRGRDLSASPAPSSLSPFPHDSPQSARRGGARASAAADVDGPVKVLGNVLSPARGRPSAIKSSSNATATASPLRIALTDPSASSSGSAPSSSRSAPAASNKPTSLMGSHHAEYIGAPPVVLSTSLALSSGSSSSSSGGGGGGGKRASETGQAESSAQTHEATHPRSLDQSASRKHRKVTSATTALSG